MDRPTIPSSIICRGAAMIAAIRTWLPKQRCGLRGRGRITEGETNIESLPDELLFNILVRLPAHKKARLVCRRWCRIIRSDAFINTDLHQYSSYGLVLSIPSYNHAIYVTATQGRIETSEFSRSKIIAASIVVEFTEGAFHNPGSLRVVNPATKQSFLLPSISEYNRLDIFYHKASIAYSAASMEYKVTLPYYNDSRQRTCLGIVSLGVDKSWRHVEISFLPRDLRTALVSSSPVSSEGFVHWGRGRYCLTLNVETEIITMSEAPPIPPETFHHSYINYLTTGRYLTLLVCRGEFSWEVWEMIPERGEWRKVLRSIDLEAKKCWLREKCDKHLDLKPLGWVKYPEILALCCSRTCIFYNRETHEIKTMKLPYKACSDYRGFVHRNSLVCV